MKEVEEVIDKYKGTFHFRLAGDSDYCLPYDLDGNISEVKFEVLDGPLAGEKFWIEIE